MEEIDATIASTAHYRHTDLMVTIKKNLSPVVENFCFHIENRSYIVVALLATHGKRPRNVDFSTYGLRITYRVPVSVLSIIKAIYNIPKGKKMSNDIRQQLMENLGHPDEMLKILSPYILEKALSES